MEQVDHGHGIAYGQLSHQKADDGSVYPSGADVRTIHISWLAGRSDPRGSTDVGCADGGQLSSFRDMRFDPRIGARGALIEVPIAECVRVLHQRLDGYRRQSHW